MKELLCYFNGSCGNSTVRDKNHTHEMSMVVTVVRSPSVNIVKSVGIVECYKHTQ